MKPELLYLTCNHDNDDGLDYVTVQFDCLDAAVALSCPVDHGVGVLGASVDVQLLRKHKVGRNRESASHGHFSFT